MPTALPPRRRIGKKPKLSVFSILLNTFLLVSALGLTFVVLVREEQYALASPDASDRAAPDIGERMQAPPG